MSRSILGLSIKLNGNSARRTNTERPKKRACVCRRLYTMIVYVFVSKFIAAVFASAPIRSSEHWIWSHVWSWIVCSFAQSTRLRSEPESHIIVTAKSIIKSNRNTAERQIEGEKQNEATACDHSSLVVFRLRMWYSVRCVRYLGAFRVFVHKCYNVSSPNHLNDLTICI